MPKPTTHPDAHCLTTPGLDWHADDTRDRAAAAYACRGCPIQLACAEAAISRHETWGVWGGFDFEDITQHQKERERRWAEGATPRTKATCGTRGGVNKHYRNGEKPCRVCLDALNASRKSRANVAA